MKATDAEGHSWRYEYDDVHRMTADIDRTGLTFHFVYDEKSRCVEAWGDYGDRPDPSLVAGVPDLLADGKTRAKGIHHCRFEYGPDGYTEVAKSTEVRRYFGNRHGLLDKAVKAGTVETFSYDERGHLVAHVDEVGAAYAFKRDPRGRVLMLRDPLGNEIRIARDEAGLPIESIDALGARTVVTRDSAGNPLTVVYANGGVTSYAWDSRGLPTSVVLPNGGKWTFEYDAHGNCTRRVQPDGTEMVARYDFFGRLVHESEGAWSMQHTYSERGDLVQTRDADGLVDRFEYDGEGNLVATTDKAGRTYRIEYGGYHVRCGETDPSGESIRLRYDREMRLVQVINQRGEEYRFTYNPGGYCTETKTFDGRSYSFSYDPAGRLRRVIDGLRRVTLLEHDLRGDLVSRELHDGSVEKFEYDARQEMVKIESPAETIELERDVMGACVRETHTTARGTFKLERTYDLVGNVVRTSTSDGLDVSIERNALGAPSRTRLGFASAGGGSVAEIAHRLDGFGRELERLLPRGGRIESAFDVRGLITSRRALRAGAGPMVHGPAVPEYVGEQTSHYSHYRKYTYNAVDNLTGVSGPPGASRGYEYDLLGNLVAVDLGAAGGRREYRYDPANFRMDAAPTKIGAGGRILERGAVRYVWDADGQLVEKRAPSPEGGERVHKFSWTAKGQLESVDLPDSSRVEFTYDAFWRRIEKRVFEKDVVSGARKLSRRTRFHWDDDRMIHETTDHYDGAKVREVGQSYWFEDARSTPLAQHEARAGADGEWLHYVTDQAGMPEALLSAEGDVVAALDRDEWGAARMKPGAKASTPLRLQGQYADEETGLSYNRFRYYDPETGHYISADPIGIDGGLEAYAYAPEPLTWIDPLGLAKSRSMKLGDQLEEKRKAELTSPTQGFSIVDTKVGSGNGIDILAVKRNPEPTGPVVAARIEECKTGASKLGDGTGPNKDTKQMSTDWQKTKLQQARAKALAKGDCQAVKDIDGTLALMKNNPSAVQSVVVHQGIKKDSLGRRKLAGPITERTVKPNGSKDVTLSAKTTIG